MEITMISAVIVMAAYFLLLYGVVGFVQDKRFFGSAPKENLAAIPDKKERFPGAHTIGWAIIAVALLLFVGAQTLAVWVPALPLQLLPTFLSRAERRCWAAYVRLQQKAAYCAFYSVYPRKCCYRFVLYAFVLKLECCP